MLLRLPEHFCVHLYILRPSYAPRGARQKRLSRGRQRDPQGAPLEMEMLRLVGDRICRLGKVGKAPSPPTCLLKRVLLG